MRVLPIVVAGVVGMATSALADVGESAIERARKSTLSSDYQAELPNRETTLRVDLRGGGDRAGQGSGSGSAQGAGGGSGQKRDPRLGKRAERHERYDTREVRPREADDGAGVFSIFLWGLLAVGAALLVFWFVSEFIKPAGDTTLPAADDKDAKVKAQTAAIIDKPLDDADVLASQGKYVEAIHTLLLRTLHELARSAMVRVERSHTSREILARVPLLADARDALSVLITYVELTHFGDEPASESDYARCREQFNRFAEAFRAGLAVQQRAPQKGGGTSAA